MSNVLSIALGPFAGTTFQEQDGFARAQEDGTTSVSIRLAVLTQAFLAMFPPEKGWSVVVSGDFVPVDMVPLPRREDPMAAANHVPSAKFVATLTSPEGRVIGTASSLWTIQGPTDWEKGETNARARLYEAMGLQSRFGETMPVEGGSEARRRGPVAVASVSPMHSPTEKKAVTVTPVVEEDVPTKATEETAASTTDKAGTEDARAEATPQGKAEVVSKADDAKVDAPTGKKATSPAAPAPAQSGMELGETDPLLLPPPAAMVTQIERLAKLFQKKVPELATKQQAMDFLAELQGKGG